MTFKEALHQHYPEYLMEGALLGLFMISACLFVALFEYPGSPVHQFIPQSFVRTALIGIAMGLTAISLIYSPWGQQSGAHMNPSVTLTFFRLGKVKGPDLVFYVLAQALGGAAGVFVSSMILGGIVAHPSVNYAATLPGPHGALVAFAAEVFISFLMMSMVLRVSNHPAWSRLTGICGGVLVATFITFEGRYSGMSMNPARTFASAFPGHIWTSFWVYLTAPPLGMLFASQVYTWQKKRATCAKLVHENSKRCIFCGARM